MRTILTNGSKANFAIFTGKAIVIALLFGMASQTHSASIDVVGGGECEVMLDLPIGYRGSSRSPYTSSSRGDLPPSNVHPSFDWFADDSCVWVWGPCDDIVSQYINYRDGHNPCPSTLINKSGTYKNGGSWSTTTMLNTSVRQHTGNCIPDIYASSSYYFDLGETAANAAHSYDTSRYGLALLNDIRSATFTLIEALVSCGIASDSVNELESCNIAAKNAFFSAVAGAYRRFNDKVSGADNRYDEKIDQLIDEYGFDL